MGKKAKEHRKKVAKRNAEIQTKLRSFQKNMQQSMQEIARKETITKDYATITTQLPPEQAAALLEEGGPRFS
jgi:C4-dicarboxylate-specific signal transduction histidine kinase